MPCLHINDRVPGLVWSLGKSRHSIAYHLLLFTFYEFNATLSTQRKYITGNITSKSQYKDNHHLVYTLLDWLVSSRNNTHDDKASSSITKTPRWSCNDNSHHEARSVPPIHVCKDTDTHVEVALCDQVFAFVNRDRY